MQNFKYNKGPPPHSLGCRTLQYCYSALDLSSYYSTRNMSIIWHLDHSQMPFWWDTCIHPKTEKWKLMKCETFHHSPTKSASNFPSHNFLVVFDPTEWHLWNFRLQIKQNKFQCLACIWFKGWLQTYKIYFYIKSNINLEVLEDLWKIYRNLLIQD